MGSSFVKGQLDVPLTVYPWYLLCSTSGFLGITHKYAQKKGISHDGVRMGTLVFWYIPARQSLQMVQFYMATVAPKKKKKRK